MKISDFIHRYPTRIGTQQDGLCRVRIFSDGIKIKAIITDLGDLNPSLSVSDMIERIIDSLITRGYVKDFDEIFEHYDFGDYNNKYFVVNFDSFGEVGWTEVTMDVVLKRLSCDAEGLGLPLMNDSRLLAEVYRIRNEIDPMLDLPIIPDHKLVLKKFKICENMVEKNSLIELIDGMAGEHALQRLIKKDLSLIAEVYAHPYDEYICFSEFKLDNGVVDFVIFTGRSRMDVILIEVKGADFNIMNKGTYNKLSKKVDDAIDQLLKRVKEISENYSKYRQGFHEIRRNVESGKNIFNSQMGPKPALLVDGNKDINLRCVFIGGRMVDDLKESSKRHMLENKYNINVCIETWDSWIRKLRRN